MKTLVPFIDREEELTIIDKAIREWGTRRVLFIDAPGGIGKTRLLQEVRDRYSLSAPSFFYDKVERKHITIALVQEFTASEWSRQFIAGAQNMASELGAELIQTDAGFSVSKMAIDLDSIVLESPDAIVINLGSYEKLRQGIQRAIKCGIKVLTSENYLRIDGLTARVEHQDEQGAHSLLEKLAEDINFHGKIAVVSTDDLVPLRRRRRVLNSILEKYPDLEVVAEYGTSGENTAEDTYKQTMAILAKHPDLRALWTTWDEFAKGVVRALLEAGRTDILVYSFDLSPSDADLMLQSGSPWVATVDTNPRETGRVMIRLATQAAYGFEVKPYYSLPMTLVTQESLRQKRYKNIPICTELDIGWTLWLRSLQTTEQRLLVADIIDLDDLTLHIPQNLRRKIAEMLGESAFEPYLQAMLDWRRMEMAGVSLERLEEEESSITQIFVDCFNSVSTEQRVVLFLDTTDTITVREAWHSLIRPLTQPSNTVLLVAGRNAREIGESALVELDEEAQIVDLQPLELKGSELYLQRKQGMLHITLEPGLVRKVLLLAGGRPILLDLVVEWLARQIPLDWLVKSDLEELESLSSQTLRNRRREFEYQLVHHIADTREPMDWLTLMMARVYPLNVQMITELLRMPADRAQVLFEEAQACVFIKSLPDSHISLHDEMRRMINEYVWSEVDPDGTRRRQDSRLIAEYLERKIQELTIRLDQLDKEENIAHRERDPQAVLRAFLESEGLERRIWLLKGQQLEHRFFYSIDEGVRLFANLFDEAVQAYRFRFQETLMAEAQKHSDRFTDEQMYEFESRKVKHLQDYGQYVRAEKLVTEVLARKGLSPEQQADMLIQRGNVKIRLGYLEQGISDFKGAVEITKQHGLSNRLVAAFNARGWAYRNQGSLDLALEDYSKAYQLSLQLDDLYQTASILNNMGYLYALRGDKSPALGSCQEALRLREEIGSRRDIGITYSTLGEVFGRFDQLAKALDNYNKALEIFAEEDDIEWINTVKCGRASVYIDQERLVEAESDLNSVLEGGPEHLKPRALHYLARVYWKRNQLIEAQVKFQECRELSQRIGSRLYDYWSFADLMDIAWELGEYRKWQEFHNELMELYFERKSEEAFRVRGSCLRKIGDLAICSGCYNIALAAYKEGLELITKYEVHMPYTVGAQLSKTEARIHKCLTIDQIRNLGRDLAEFWVSNQGLLQTFPGALVIFNRWQREGEDL